VSFRECVAKVLGYLQAVDNGEGFSYCGTTKEKRWESRFLRSAAAARSVSRFCYRGRSGCYGTQARRHTLCRRVRLQPAHGEDEEATLRTLTSNRQIIDSLIENHYGCFVNSAGDSVARRISKRGRGGELRPSKFRPD
jgi:hypothetical protein